MDKQDLETLIRDVESLRKAVRRNSPLLRAVADTRSFGYLSLPFGVFLVVFALGTHFLLQRHGSFAALPAGWKLLMWVVIGLFTLAAGVAKVVIVGRRARRLDSGAGFLSVVKVMYGGSWAHVNLTPMVAMLGVSAWVVTIGKPWLVMPMTGLFFGLVANGFGTLVGRPEYYATGWYALLSSLAALFFVESAPWLWLAATYGGMFLVFGAVALWTERSGGDGEGGEAAEGEAPRKGPGDAR